MHKNIISIVLVTLFALFTFSAHAQETPVGLWKNIDDVTGKPKALIRITEKDGVYSGTIEKLFRSPEEEQDPHCTKCTGEDKDKRVTGMVILKGLKKEGDEYTGGTILDPKNGTNYRSKLTLEDDGKKLKMRGYIGFSLFGRTQTWIREQ